MSIKVIASNRKARHNYAISDTWEAGISLQGTEVKALRQGKANLSDGWVDIAEGEAFLKEDTSAPIVTATEKTTQKNVRENSYSIKKKSTKWNERSTKKDLL